MHLQAVKGGAQLCPINSRRYACGSVKPGAPRTTGALSLRVPCWIDFGGHANPHVVGAVGPPYLVRLAGRFGPTWP